MKHSDQKIRTLLWREYLRGYIDGGHKGKPYDLAVLKSQYRQYMKLNPSVLKDFQLKSK